ncbi:histidine kinase [Herbaspirillum robiniae]|uniref:Histidine kinase n=1 Tax=Herbaspirillum robiniae TaxID=2014887 RepID=A0A246WKT2_9BURK|nr:histidine kinase [Herbaspirillum robiniae]OWY26927.1 histidine kinase [Herbaspirillum robiniae]
MESFAELRILVAEDEESKIKEWVDAIAAHNVDVENKKFSVNAQFAKSVQGALSLIGQFRFDAAVVDLRLEIEDGVEENNTNGNDLVRHILVTEPMGVVVYTGQQSEADDYRVPQVRIMNKGEGLAQVFDWLSSNKDLFLRLRAANQTFNRETAKIFFGSIWPRWNHWTSDSLPGNQSLTDVLARHVVAHVHDALLDASGDRTHPEETYFVPPIKNRLDTGDLVNIDGDVWIVVTPRCDLASAGKVETILLAKCKDVSELWAAALGAGAKSERKCNELIQHERMPKQHFLHPMRDNNSQTHGPWMAQFHHIRALPAAEAVVQLLPLRFASLSPLFVPSLVERFGAYFSRIGTPAYSSE